MPKNIALVAHDRMKANLIAWVNKHQQILKQHQLYATGSTGRILSEKFSMNVCCFESGPLGGDQQLGAKIVDREIDMLVFFWDPLEAQPHDPDVRALLRIAVVWNIAVACNETTADILIESKFMSDDYQLTEPDYSKYRTRELGL